MAGLNDALQDLVIKKMTGATLPGNSTVEFREFDIPEPGYGEVLVATRASTICGSDIRAIYRDYQAIGDKVWDLFCVKDKASHEWHFRGLARALASLKGTFAYDEFAETIGKVFGK